MILSLDDARHVSHRVAHGCSLSRAQVASEQSLPGAGIQVVALQVFVERHYGVIALRMGSEIHFVGQLHFHAAARKPVGL